MDFSPPAGTMQTERGARAAGLRCSAARRALLAAPFALPFPGACPGRRNVVAGPAIIESEDTTILVPAGKKYTVDRLLNGIIEKA